MKIFRKDEFYRKVIGVNYKYGISDIEKKISLATLVLLFGLKKMAINMSFLVTLKESHIGLWIVKW